MRGIGVATLAVCALLGCDDERPELREWRPDDHQQPTQADPDRTPGGDTPPTEPIEPPSPEAIARAAAAVFRTSCATCHGESGRGDGPEAPAGARMPDLTLSGYHESHTDAQIGAVISSGRGMMPAFGWLNANGIAALVGHVRSLNSAAPSEAAAPGAVPAQPASAEPGPAEPAPAEPGPAEPAPAEPAPSPEPEAP